MKTVGIALHMHVHARIFKKTKWGFFFFFLVAQMLKKITSEESLRDNSTAELDALKHRDWVRQWPRTVRQSEGFPCGDVRAQLCSFFCLPGTPVGAADEGAAAGREAEEGAGAALQHSAHGIQPDALRDADAGHPRSQLPAAQSHGEQLGLVVPCACRRFTLRRGKPLPSV